CVPRQTLDSTHNRIEPFFELDALATLGKCKDSEPEFAERDRINDEVAFVRCQPGNNFGIRPRLSGLTYDIGVNEVGHPSLGAEMSSVVSLQFNGWNQPLTGQARRSFTMPSLGRFLRLSRYSPLSIRSTSNSCPASMRSCLRILAGKTICPLLETVVVMDV